MSTGASVNPNASVPNQNILGNFFSETDGAKPPSSATANGVQSGLGGSALDWSAAFHPVDNGEETSTNPSLVDESPQEISARFHPVNEGASDESLGNTSTPLYAVNSAVTGNNLANTTGTDPQKTADSQALAQRPREHRELDDVFTREDNENGLRIVSNQRNAINRAASLYKVAPQVVAANYFEESRRYGDEDLAQDAALRVSARTLDRNWTHGPAQMSPQTLRTLLNNGWLDSANGASIPGFRLVSRADYQRMSANQKLEYERSLLLSRPAAPYLIAAESAQTVAIYKNRLPSIALPQGGKASIRDTNHYRLLTQTYSTGPGIIENTIATRGDALRRYANVNARAIQAVSNYGPITEALNGKILSFEGAQYNKTPGGYIRDHRIPGGGIPK